MKDYDSPFFFVLFVICLLRYYVYIFLCKLELFWAWPSYTRIPTNQISYSYSYSYAYETPILCSCRLLYWSHADSRIFSIFQYRPLCWVKTSTACSCRASYRVYRSRCTGKSVSPSPVFLAQLIAYRDAQFCMHLVVENKMCNLYLHLSFSVAVWTLSWSCV